VSVHGLVIDLLYLADVAIEVAFRKQIAGEDYFRTKGIFKKNLGSSFIVDAVCLFPYYAMLVIVTAASIEVPVSSWLFFAMRLPQLVSRRQ
jgi:hypothetical protein